MVARWRVVRHIPLCYDVNVSWANRARKLLLLGCAVAVGASFSTPAQAGPHPTTVPVAPLNNEGYVSLIPARVLDTRTGGSTADGLAVGGGAVGPNEVIDLTVLGRGGVPLSGVGSVALHVTAVGQTVTTFITVYPKGIAWPGTSNLNPVPGSVASNLVIVPVGAGGQVSLFNSAGSVQIIADVQGWFPAGPRFTGVTPARVADTRVLGTKVGAGQSLAVQVAGVAGVPTSGVSAVVLNVTSLLATTQTFVTVYPSGTTVPGTSNLNTQLGNIAANLVVTPMGADGKIAVRNESGSVDVIVDVLGWFAIGEGYTPVTPARVADTRATTPLTADSSRSFQLTGVAGIPTAGVGSVVFNVTAVNHTASTYLTVYPNGSPRPLSSSLNPHPGTVAPNLVIGKVGSDGAIRIYNEQGTVDVILDVVGWLPSNVVAGDDTLIVTEDDAAAAVAVLTNDTDLDGSPLGVQSVTQPAHGTSAVVSGGLSVTYQPNADYCNTSGPVDTFTYTLFGGAIATVSVTVACVDDVPVAVNDHATVNEDAAATAISVLANDTDVDAGLKTVASKTDGAHGTVVITGGGTGLTYQPVADYCNTNAGPDDQFTYTLNGGSVGTGSVTVTCVNDAPSFTKGADQTVVENAGVQSVAAWATAITKGPPNESAQNLTFNITANTNGGLFAVAPAVSPTGTLTYTPTANATGTATITLTLSDSGGTANGGVDTSASTTFNIVVSPANLAPVATSSSVSSLEDTAKVITLSATDGNDDTLTFSVTSGPGHGSLGSIGAPDCTTTLNICTATVTYTPSANYNGADSFTFRVNDGTIDSNTATIDLAVAAVNDVPSFTKGADQTVLEDAGAQTVVGWATAINKGAANETGQTLTFNVSGNTNTGLFAVAPAVSPSGTLTYTPAANANGTATITLNVSDDGGTANGGVDSSATQTFTISVTAVNDAPSFNSLAGNPAPVNEDAAAQTVLTFAAGMSAGPASESAQTYAFVVTANSNATLFSAGPAISPTGTLTYTPAADQHGTATITIKLQDNGGTANGGVDSSATQQFTITVNAVNDVPTSPGRDYGAASLQTNMRRSLAANEGLLFGAADAADVAGNAGYTPTLSLGTVNGVTPVSGTITTTIGGVGTVVANVATGAFTIDPAPGVTGAVQFDFTVCDTGEGSPPTQCSATAVAKFTIAGPVIWFVDPSSGTNGVGTLASPFNVLSAADGVDAASHRVFVFNGTTTTGLTLNTGEWLIGQSATGPFDTVFGLTPPTGTIARPTMGVGTTTIGGTVTLAATAKVQGVAINTGAAAGLVGSGPISGISVSESSVTTTTGTAVNLTNAAGTYTLSSVTTSGAANGILLDTLGTSVVTVNGGAIVGATTRGVDINSGSGNFTFAGTITTSTAGRSVEVTSHGGGTLAFSGAINDTGLGINLSSNAGATMNFSGGVIVSSTVNNAFNATGGGTVAVTGTSNTLSTTTGTALNVVSTTIGAGGMNFQSISAGTAAAGPGSGIVLNTTGSSGGLTVTGAAAANSGGTIRSTTGVGISLTSTRDVSLTKMLINSSAGSGIDGTGVVNFSLTNSTITNSGTGLGADTANVAFNRFVSGTENNVSGTLVITGNTLQTSLWHGISILNASGTLSSVDISTNAVTSATAGASSLGNGIELQAIGSASTVANVTIATITNNTVVNFPSGGGILAQGGNANAAGPSGIFGTPGTSNRISITGNLVHGESAASRMNTSPISATVSGKGVGNFNVSNNGTVAVPLGNSSGTVILVGGNGNTTSEFLVQNNVIVANNTVGSQGIGAGTGTTFGNTDTPLMDISILNNSISATDGNGILAVARGAAGQLNAKIQNNTVAAPLTGNRPGIRVDAGNNTSTGDKVCLNISGNTSAGSGLVPEGIGLRRNSAPSGVFAVNGMAATASPNVETYINSLNPAGNGTLLISATTGFTSCTLP